jgi:hypothetical protein
MSMWPTSLAGRRLLKAAIAIVACLAAAQVEVAIHCSRPSPVPGVASEACVWGRAYLPLTRVLYTVLVGPLLYALLTAAEGWRDRRGR